MKVENSDEPDEWTKNYILGIVSEIDEVLDAIRWKRHRRESFTSAANLGYELADITKYLISLWQIWGFTWEDMLTFCIAKSEMLERQLDQEFADIPTDRPVLICDIDGTLGDWRATFISWASSKGYKPLIEDPATTLMLDADLNMRYPEYYDLKASFEEEGGYRFIKPYEDVVETVKHMVSADNYYLIITTARPASQYKRIWMDTWEWLEEQGIKPDQVLMTGDRRVLLADGIQVNGSVIIFDDDPSLILRAANSGIRVFGRRTPYNEGIKHGKVTILEKFSWTLIEEFLRETN